LLIEVVGGKARTPRNNAGMNDVTTNDDWTDRQQAQAAGFDAIGTRYDEVFPHKEGQIRTVEQLLERLPAGARVLDLGCGTGVPTARQLVDGGCQVTGVDISPVMLDQARRNVPEATFLQRDIVDAAAADDRFDAVVAFFSLLMLPRERTVEVLSSLRDVIMPSGWLAMGMVEGDFNDVPVPFLGAPLRVSAWPRDQLKQMVTGAGFAVVMEDVRSYAPPIPEAPPETQLFLLAQRI
jgi:ubiquinone/menaquinone biosynthesis C-methylase UbiE